MNLLRIIGAVLITASTAGWGILSVMQLRSRVGSLRTIAGALGVIRSEICDRLTPMTQLVRTLSEQAAYPASVLFQNVADKIDTLDTKPFSFIWNHAVKNTPELLLTDSEEQVLLELGQSLGRYDAKEQAGAIAYAQRRLDECIRRAEHDRDANSKVRAFLGVAAGLFAIVILL